MNNAAHLSLVNGQDMQWRRLLLQLQHMVRVANESGLRYRSKRGRGFLWVVYPREYLLLTQQLGAAPAAVRAAVREVTQ